MDAFIGCAALVGLSRQAELTLLELHKLQTFVAAAEHGNFGRAAEALGIRQPTVSRHVRDLEEQLAVLLFERHAGGVRLTPAGRAVLASARRALQILGDATHHAACASRAERGELGIGVLQPPVSGPLAALLAAHRRRHRHVDLTLFESHHLELHSRLLSRRLDAAFLIEDALTPDLESMLLWRERLMAAVPADSALAQGRCVTWSQLARETLLVQGWEGCSVPRELVVRKMGVNVRFRQHVASQHSVLGLVGAGYGSSIVMEMLAGASVPGVAFQPIDEPDATTEVHLAWLKGIEEPVLGRFVAFVRDELKLHPHSLASADERRRRAASARTPDRSR